MEELKKLRTAEESTVALADEEMWLCLGHWLCPSAVYIGCALSMRTLAQGLVEELKKLRAAEESTVALVDEEMTARFSGDVTLTVCDAPIVLSPHQVCLGFRQPLIVRHAPIILSMHHMPVPCHLRCPHRPLPAPGTFRLPAFSLLGLIFFCQICQRLARSSHMARARSQTVRGAILVAMAHSHYGGKSPA